MVLAKAIYNQVFKADLSLASLLKRSKINRRAYYLWLNGYSTPCQRNIDKMVRLNAELEQITAILNHMGRGC